MKRSYYSIDLANYYMEACRTLVSDLNVKTFVDEDLKAFDRLEWLANIWLDIHYRLHPGTSND